jgi:hypothetical protein
MIEANVGPAQAEDLASAPAVRDQQSKRGMQRIILGRGDELPGLVGSPWPGGAGLPFGEFDEPCDAAVMSSSL